MKRIIITVDPKGQTQVETQGFQGAGCREASRFVEQALGKPLSERLTAEFHASPVSEPPLQQGQ